MPLTTWERHKRETVTCIAIVKEGKSGALVWLQIKPQLQSVSCVFLWNIWLVGSILLFTLYGLESGVKLHNNLYVGILAQKSSISQ